MLTRSTTRLSVLFATLALAALLLPAHAFALSGTNVTVTNGIPAGAPTQLKFGADVGPDETVSALTLVLPKGSDLSSTTVRLDVTAKDLSRTKTAVTPEIEGDTLKLTFTPPIAPDHHLIATLDSYVTPLDGGTYAVRGSYETSAGVQEFAPAEFVLTQATRTDRVVHWLDRQPWVESWNSVRFLNGFFKPQLIAQSIPLLFWGWLLSIGLIALAYPAAIPIGLATAFVKMSKIPPLRWLASLYINVIRGTPLFLQIYIAFFGLPLIGIQLPDFPLGVAVLAFNSAAYMAEIFRAGIQSINKGQFEAASSLGMTYPQAMAYVIIPQTVRRVLPTMTSEFILLFKDTALLSAVGIFELMMYGKNSAANTGNVTAYTIAAVYYLIVTLPLINWVGSLEARLAVSEGGQTVKNPRRRGMLRSLLGSRELEPATPPAGEEA